MFIRYHENDRVSYVVVDIVAPYHKVINVRLSRILRDSQIHNFWDIGDKLLELSIIRTIFY